MGLDGVSRPPTPRGTDIELPRQPAGFEFCEYCSHAVNYVLHYSGASEYARMVCAYGVLFGWLAGSFFHSLEESGHLEGMVLSVFLQSVEESAR